MPASAAKIYGYLAGEILRTRAKWIYFRQLFMDDAGRTAKLNKAGGDFFGELMNILVDDLVLSLSRLTDPARNAHQENLTLSLFIEKIQEAGCLELAATLRKKNDTCKEVVSSLRTRRAKRIAHYDSGTIISPDESPLPPLTLKDIRVTIETIESFLGEANTYFTKGTFMWDELRTYNDVETLMVCLCKAEVYDELVDKGRVDRFAWRNKWGNKS
jgi:hypothetical protein